MNANAALSSLVVNFNSPELNQLALALARRGELAAFVRPYVNKGRSWERALESLPLAGSLYAGTFGRRRLLDEVLRSPTQEAGIAPDMLAALVSRMGFLPNPVRHRWANALYKSVRVSVAEAAARRAAMVSSVVAYEGFALPSFVAAKAEGRARTVLNYPVAHHRNRRERRLQELALEPDFASTWPDFDDWPAGHEERLDEEIALADAVLLGSTYARDTFVGEGIAGEKLAVVPYGVDLQNFRPGEPRGRGPQFSVVYAGQLTQRKGLSYLLRGYAKFRRDDTTLTLVGSPVGDPKSLAPFAHLFKHLPHQTRGALANLYRSADAFAFPTLVEGMPLVVLEAMACGLPVVVTANGPADIVRDGVDGFIIPERDADALCERLDRLYRQPDLCRQMGLNAAARALEFSWDSYCRRAIPVVRGADSKAASHEEARSASGGLKAAVA